MKNHFWRWMQIAACTTAIWLSTPTFIAAWQQHPTPQPKASPNAPTNQNVPLGLDGKPNATESAKPSVDQQNEQEIRLEVQRLYALATALKDEVDNTNSQAVLSVTVVKRAQEIEKLAKHIRDRAKR